MTPVKIKDKMWAITANFTDDHRFPGESTVEVEDKDKAVK